MKKYFLIILLLFVALTAQSQLRVQTSKSGWVTTAIDTFQFTTQTITPACLTVTSDSLSSGILEFCTDAENVDPEDEGATWRMLLPDDAAYTYAHSKGKYLYRRALVDSVYSRAFAD